MYNYVFDLIEQNGKMPIRVARQFSNNGFLENPIGCMKLDIISFIGFVNLYTPVLHHVKGYRATFLVELGALTLKKNFVSTVYRFYSNN